MSPTTDRTLDEHLAAFQRGAVDLIDERQLRARLEAARREQRGLRVKFGMDPSSADLHLGHSVVLMKLRDLQALGHTIVLIVGDSTAMVGDPSGRNKLRPQLSREQVEENLVTYVDQAAHLLDPDATEVRRNSEWFDRMGFEDVLRLASRMTVARMLERDTFEQRVAQGEAIGIHEFLYPLMQGWDSVQVRADVELGGTDQLFNLLVGRHLQEQEGMPAQICLTTPLIEGLDGRKMSKSYGNAIAFGDPAREMFARVMSLKDEGMPLWFELLTRLDPEAMAAALAGHPREAKALLAAEITRTFHGPEGAREGREAFDRQFRDKELPDDIPSQAWRDEWDAAGVPLSVLLRELGLAQSSSEARRLIQQGAVKLDGEAAQDPQALVAPPAAPVLIKVGKRRYLHLEPPGSAG